MEATRLSFSGPANAVLRASTSAQNTLRIARKKSWSFEARNRQRKIFVVSSSSSSRYRNRSSQSIEDDRRKSDGRTMRAKKSEMKSDDYDGILCRSLISTTSRSSAGRTVGDVDDDDDDDEKEKNYRFTILALIAFALLLCNADRVIMSIVGLPMAEMNDWNVKALGLIQSAFLFGYALTPIFGGVMADKIGGARVLLVGLLIWSFATICTPMAAMTKSIPLLCLCRAVMGLGEGVALPCMNNVASRWVPKFERSRAVSFCMGGFQSGSMIGLLVAPLLMQKFGIAGPFYVFGSVGLVWALIWTRMATSYPRNNKRVSKKELKFIESGGAIVVADSSSSSPSEISNNNDGDDGKRRKKMKTPWRMLLSHPATWACVVANFVNNFGFFILLAWMPKYFNDVVRLNLQTSSWFSALPWATMAISGVFAGILADKMISEWSISNTVTRKFIQTIGFCGPAICLLILGLKGFAITPIFALTTLTIAVGCTAFSQSGFLVNFAEIGPKYASTIHGIANTAGSIAGMIGTYVVGWILQNSPQRGWSEVMFLTSAVYIFGSIVWLLFMSGEKVFD